MARKQENSGSSQHRSIDRALVLPDPNSSYDAVRSRYGAIPSVE
jgi:hypothetical protein